MQCPHRALHFFCLSSSPLPLTKTFFVNFLEVTKEKRIFAAIVPKVECTTFLDCWIYNLKYMEIVEQFPCEALDKIFKKLAEYADSKTLTKEEQEKYDNSMMVMWDNYAVYKYAVEKAYKKGYEKGYKIGYEEERKKVSKKVALKLLTYNTPIDVIAKSTGLSIDEIKKLEQYN